MYFTKQSKYLWLTVFIGLSLFFVNQVEAKSTVKSASLLTVNIAILAQLDKPAINLSIIDPVVLDKGELGAELAIQENNITGEFIGQSFTLKKFIVPANANAETVFNEHIVGKFNYLVTLLSPEKTLAIADLARQQALLILDAATVDDSLRNTDCRESVLHLLPSRAMRADALGQYSIKKRWHKWFLVVGAEPADQLFAEAIKRTAKRFNIKIVAEKQWSHTFDARKTAQAEIDVFTQIEDDYDVLVVADEQNLFGEYLDYRTWSPRPIIGTQGLSAVAWHPTHDLWGATQIQKRFKTQAGRWMNEQDYAAYLAIRALGEAVTRTHSSAWQALKNFMLSDRFVLQGYKGSALSFRAWDGQLRQPILLAAPRSLVAVAPIEGFLHPKTELDTLGYDAPESLCKRKE